MRVYVIACVCYCVCVRACIMVRMYVWVCVCVLEKQGKDSQREMVGSQIMASQIMRQTVVEVAGNQIMHTPCFVIWP